jgi:predicted  nucleic acid-binding Zn-ribbon protein
VLPILTSLIALQQLDTAAEALKRRLAELPAAEQAIERAVAAARARVEQATTALAANQLARRDFEKQVAAVDTRLSRFEDHKAAVKTNQEFTALLHEISTAKKEKDSLEDQILGLMEAAEALSAAVTAANADLAETNAKSEAEQATLAEERRVTQAELDRLKAEKAAQSTGVDAVTLSRYEKLLTQRRMLAITAIEGERCTACHVRLRPAVIQQIRRGVDVIACDSCQRLLYAPPETTPAQAS